MKQINNDTIKHFAMSADPSVFLDDIKIYFEDNLVKTNQGEATLYHVLAQMNGMFTGNILSYFMNSCSTTKNGIQLKADTFDDIISNALNTFPSRSEVREQNVKLYHLGKMALNSQNYTLAIKLYEKYRENYERIYSDQRLNGYTSARMFQYFLFDEKPFFKDFTLEIASVFFSGKPGVPKNLIKAAQIIDLTGYEMNPYDKNRTLISDEITGDSAFDPDFYFKMSEYFSIHGAFIEANYSSFDAYLPTDYDDEAIEISVAYPLRFFINAYRGGVKKIPKGIGRALHMAWAASHGNCHPEDETRYNSFRIICLERLYSFAIAAINEEISAGNMDAIFENEILNSLYLRYRILTQKDFNSHLYFKNWDRSLLMKCIESGNADAEYLLGLFYRYQDIIEVSYKCMSHAAASGSERAIKDLPNYKKKLFGMVYEKKDKFFMTFYRDVKPNK